MVEEGPVTRTGQTHHTSAGALNYQHIVHVIRPCPGSEDEEALQLLEDCMYNALRHAANLDAHTVVLPGICVGTFGYTKLPAAATNLRALWDFCRSTERGGIKTIHIIDPKVKVVKALMKASKQLEVTGKPRRILPIEAEPKQTPPVVSVELPLPEESSSEEPQELQKILDKEECPKPSTVPEYPWPLDPVEVRRQQEKEPRLAEMIQYLESDILPQATQQAKRLIKYGQDFVMQNNVLYHIWTQRGKGSLGDRTHLQLVVPGCYQEVIMRQYHQHPLSGHMGLANVLLNIKFRYFWKGMTKDIEKFLSQCIQCAKSSGPGNRRNAPLQKTSPAAPFQRTHADVLGPLATSEKGYKYVLVMVDSFTRWTEMVALKNQTAATIANCIYKEWICRHGVPQEIVTDKGSNFLAQIVQELSHSLGIKRVTTSSYHPAANSLCERRNAVITSSLKKIIQNNPADWPGYLSSVQFALNTTVNQSTHYSPYFLVYGRKAKRPIDVVLAIEETPVPSIQDHVTQLLHKVHVHETLAREWDTQSREVYKKYYDAKIKVENLQEGDLVWMYTPAVGRDVKIGKKLQSPWDGPYQILKFTTPVTVEVQRICDGVKLDGRIHLNRLKRYISHEIMPEIPEEELEEGEKETY